MALGDNARFSYCCTRDPTTSVCGGPSNDHPTSGESSGKGSLR